MLESIHHNCLSKELNLQEISFTSAQIITVSYKELILNTELSAALYIENCMVVEMKAIEGILPIHDTELLTSMNIFVPRKGILINFDCITLIKKNKKSFVNSFYRDLLE